VEDLDYKVELWDARGGIERVLARVAILSAARAAFEASVAHYPGRPITLRQGARVIADSERLKL
jgi:hypothetical protein